MKLLFAFFVLFATQIISLKAQMHWKNNALGITGINKPQIKFWRNPFSREQGRTACHVFIEGLSRRRGGGTWGGRREGGGGVKISLLTVFDR